MSVEWKIYVILIIVVASCLFAFFCSKARRYRRFNRLLSSRDAMSDEELLSTYYNIASMNSTVPCRVRLIVSCVTHYPMEKLLPDDDLTFYWDDYDLNTLINMFETEFGISITAAEFIKTPCTIREMSRLVNDKLRELSY